MLGWEELLGQKEDEAHDTIPNEVGAGGQEEVGECKRKSSSQVEKVRPRLDRPESRS